MSYRTFIYNPTFFFHDELSLKCSYLDDFRTDVFDIKLSYLWHVVMTNQYLPEFISRIIFILVRINDPASIFRCNKVLACLFYTLKSV